MTHEITSLEALRAQVRHWRAADERVALVPTMGALHAGHLSLVKAAQGLAQRLIVSIFVNPTQFGPNEDFLKYPRPIADDIALLHTANCDAAWLPDVATMYPNGFATLVHVSGVSDGLESSVRPGHFDGVATIVAKLLHQVQPDVACFGEKDYQQLCVIRRMVSDLNIPVEIHGVPTMREADGLAMSSRNRYLSAEERPIAAALHTVLQSVAAELKNDAEVSTAMANGIALLRARGFASVDYLQLRDGATLAPLAHAAANARLLVAARLGTTRLLDNIAL